MTELQAHDTVRFTAVIKSREEEKRRFFGAGYLYKTADGSQITDHSGDEVSSPEVFSYF